jgi:hypothetical protein
MHTEIRKKRDALVGSIDQIRWCDDRRLMEENEEDVAPGGFISPFGWYVVGTTIGGNAIVVAFDDPAVYFAGHTWYGGAEINYQNLSGDRSWVCLPLTPEGVRKSLFRLAESIDVFIARASEIDATLDEID